MPIKVFSVLVLELFCLALLVEGQEDNVYIGTGVNGRLETNTDNDTVIVLGGLFSIYQNPNTPCGESDVNPRSIQRVEAMALATQKVNDDPSILPGVTLAFEIRSTCGQVNRALEESLKFVSSRSFNVGAENGTVLGISGVVGAGFSRVSTQVARLLRLFHIPQISYASTANSLSDKNMFDYFFRTVPPDSLQAQALADIVEHYNWTYVIAMHTDDVYGREGIAAFVAELGKRNSTQRCIATPQSIRLPINAARGDYDGVIDMINKEWINNATVVVMFATRKTASSVLEAVNRKQTDDPEFGARNFTWIGSDGWGDNIQPELYETAQGTLSVTPRSKSSDEFNEHFLSLHPHNFSANPWFNRYWESVFNCSLERCNLADQALSHESASLETSAVATVAMDTVYAFAHAIHKLQQDYCGGGPGLCKEVMDTRSGGIAIRGEPLRDCLYNVSFSPGASAEVISFDENGDLLRGYDVKNLQQSSSGNFTFELVGQWDETPLNRNTPLEISGEIQWSHNQGDDVPKSSCSLPCGDGEYPEPIADQEECCWICRRCPGIRDVSTGLACEECEQGYMPNERKTACVRIDVSYLMWSHAWSVIILILTCSGILATTTVAIIFIIYHKHRIIKASSRELSAVLLSGIMLSYFLPLFFIARPSPWICAIRRFSIGFCFALCYSALLVKTNRIHRIFNRQLSSVEAPPLISPLSQIFFTALLVSVQVVITIIWLVVEKPSIKLIYNDFSTELTCGESTQIGLSISLGYNFLLLLVTTYFAFRTRKVPQNFNEAKFISFTMYTLCILWLAFIPTYFASTVRLGTVFQTGSLMLAVILNASVTLCCLFVPKIYFLFSRMQKDQESRVSKSEVFTNQYKHSVNAMDTKATPAHLQMLKVNEAVGKVDICTQTDSLE